MKKTIVFSVFCCAAVLVAHILGKALNFYNIFSEYDSLVHLLGGLFAGSLGLIIFDLLPKKTYIGCFFWAIMSSLILGTLWEFQQLFFGNIGSFSDTFFDVIMDFCGGWLAWFFYIHRNFQK